MEANKFIDGPSDCCGHCPDHPTGSGYTSPPTTIAPVPHGSPCEECNKTRQTVKHLISKVETVERKIDSMTDDIKTVINKHSNYPVGVVVDDESGVAIGHKETFEHNHIRMLEASLQAAKDHAAKTDKLLRSNNIAHSLRGGKR